MSSRTIFKSLENAYIEVSKELKTIDNKDKDRINLLKQQKELLENIATYINSFEWLKHKETIERIKFFLKNKYNYQEFCNHFDITYEAAKVSISYINQRAIEKVGKNTIDLILEGKIEEAKATFLFRSGQLKLRNYMLDSALSEIPEPDYITVDIVDCEKELTFLRFYTTALMDARVKQIDKEKLAYIRYILEGDNPKLSEERLLLMDLLDCKINVKDFIKEMKEKNLYL